MRFRILLPVCMAIFMIGCSQGGGGGNSSTPPATQPPLPEGKSDCPTSQISEDQLRRLVERVKSEDDVDPGSANLQVRAGYLAFELAKAGVPDMVILQSIKNGKFAALATWLGDETVVDINKFSKCEEN